MELLTDDDRRILDLEVGNVVGHTSKLVLLGHRGDAGALTSQELADHVGGRIHRAPRLTRRLGADSDGRPAWVDDPGFDVRSHVHLYAVDEPVDGDGLSAAVSELIAIPLSRDRPLWRMDVFENVDGGSAAIVWRLHHAVADGFMGMQLAEALLWDDSLPHEPSAAPAGLGVPGEVARSGRGRFGLRWDEARATARLYSRFPGTTARELLPRYASASLDAEVKRERSLALVEAGLDELRHLGKAHGEDITLNDVILAVVAGALRMWLHDRGDALRGIRAKVPVSLHTPTEGTEGPSNRDSFFFVELPVDESDPVARLRSISRSASNRKQHRDAETLYKMPFTNAKSRWAQSLHVFTFNVSNVRGPSRPLSVAGAPVEHLYSIAEIAEHHALRIAALSSSGRVAISVCADAAAVPDLAQLERGLYASIDELRTRAGRHASRVG